MSETSRAAEPFTPSINHWTICPLGTFREKVAKAQLRGVLLNAPAPIVRGSLCQWRHRHLGVGVYELWAEKWSAPS
jgi:hypothetical protein